MIGINISILTCFVEYTTYYWINQIPDWKISWFLVIKSCQWLHIIYKRDAKHVLFISCDICVYLWLSKLTRFVPTQKYHFAQNTTTSTIFAVNKYAPKTTINQIWSFCKHSYKIENPWQNQLTFFLFYNTFNWFHNKYTCHNLHKPFENSMKRNKIQQVPFSSSLSK